MAKRQRGSTRPGQRSPQKSAARPATRPAAPVRSGTLSDDDLERAAALEAQIVEEERVAATALARGRDRRRTAADPDTSLVRPRSRASSTLAAVATDEYRYVARDLRRIAMVFGLIFGLLLVAFLILVVGGVAK